MWFRKKNTFDTNPKDLGVEALLREQGFLVARLLLVNTQLEQRYNSLADLGSHIKENEKNCEELRKSASYLKGMNVILSHELNRIAGKSS